MVSGADAHSCQAPNVFPVFFVVVVIIDKTQKELKLEFL